MRKLTQNIQLLTALIVFDDSSAITQRNFANWLLMIGEGRISEITKNSSYISMPLSIVVHDNSYQSLIDFIYLALQINASNLTYIVERSILVQCNAKVDMLNTKIVLKFPEEEKTYYSADALDQSSDMYNLAHKDIYSTKFRNSPRLSRLPPYVLMLKVRVLIILLWNIDANEGLCNST